MLSAIFTTTPTQLPSGTCVPKKHKLAVSSGSLWVHSGLRLIGSDSPVKELLSTHMFGEHSSTRMSAGTKSPCSSFTISPIVMSAASTKLTSPPLTTVTRGGRIDLNSFICVARTQSRNSPRETHGHSSGASMASRRCGIATTPSTQLQVEKLMSIGR